MRTTLRQLKASRIPNALGLCSDDPRVVEFSNEAMERLMTMGKWVGTYQRALFCVNNGCLTFPRQVETIEAIALCNTPVTIRNEWFEFLANGTGLQSADSCGVQLFDRGNACTFNDIAGQNKKIRVYADVSEEADSQILLQGYDENGIWIRTQVGDEWVDGEYVAISTSPTNSTKLFTSLTGVQKPITNGNVRLYEFNVDDSTQRAIAIYEPDEEVPSYRRSLLTGMTNWGGCCGNNDDCDSKPVTAMAKLRFVPVRVDTDYLPIGNIGAVKMGVMAVRKEENNLWSEAEQYWASAVRILNEELKSHLGDGAKVQMTVSGASQFAESVQNLI